MDTVLLQHYTTTELINELESRNENTKEYLKWLHERLIHVYGESPNVDFVQKLKKTLE
jgi:hypothetical protein